MCRENSLTQINAAIKNLSNAKQGRSLVEAQSQALSFIQASFDREEINQVEKQSLEKKVRRIYRTQIIEEST
ncbi:hypothetical protein [Acinetobacter johnsonii]|uniref:hypothetical protein n=1 Tax=Acinetobacter TaxID=469 RepID=UPI0032B40B4A